MNIDFNENPTTEIEVIIHGLEKTMPGVELYRIVQCGREFFMFTNEPLTKRTIDNYEHKVYIDISLYSHINELDRICSTTLKQYQDCL